MTTDAAELARERLRAAAARVAVARGLDPAAVEVKVYRPDRGYRAGLRWRAETWCGPDGLRDAQRVGDPAAVSGDGATPDDAVTAALEELHREVADRVRRTAAERDDAARRHAVWCAVRDAIGGSR
jgi:hypothetical protein